MKTRPWLLLLLALTLLAACGPKENCAEAHNDDRTYRLHICTDKEKYDFGAPISITFTVTNISDEPLTLDGGDEPAMDIYVEGEHWSDEQGLTLDLTHVTLEPGKSRTLSWVWPTPRTDLKEISFPPDAFPPDASIGVDGIVIPRPGASSRTVWVDVYYRRP